MLCMFYSSYKCGFALCFEFMTWTYYMQFFLERRYEEHQERSKDTVFNHYIFTDSDIAIVDDLEPIFQEYPDFDLALTFRNNKKQPLNSGFIAVRGTLNSILKLLFYH